MADSNIILGYIIPRDTNFNMIRFNESNGGVFNFTENPEHYLNITEETINSVLANISISAISLDRWTRPVEVNSTEYINVYRFSYPMNFFLWYGLCLASAIVSIAVGLKALNENGVPAADGGFLRIMMMTTGDTAMSRVIGGGCVGGGKENAPGELLKMKVRFGELLSTDDTKQVRRRSAGFRIVEETVVLRRGIR